MTTSELPGMEISSQSPTKLGFHGFGFGHSRASGSKSQQDQGLTDAEGQRDVH